MIDVCSKYKNADKNSKTVDLQCRNDDLRNLYLSPKFDKFFVERFTGIGPILTAGLCSFNNTQIIVSRNEAPYVDPKIREIAVKIRTNELKGRVDFSYKSEPLSFIYMLEFIEVEVKIRNALQYESNSQNHADDKFGEQHYYPNNVKIQVNVHAGDIRSKLQSVSVVRKVIPRHQAALASLCRSFTSEIRLHILVSLNEILNKKFQNKSLFWNCST